jgi:hypothetical protein
MKSYRKILILLAFLSFFRVDFIVGQEKNERIGIDEILKTGTNYYNYSEKDKINIEVSVWGYVKSPGKYLIPKGTSFIDLVSLTGGPLSEAKLDDIRIVRTKNDSLGIKKDIIINLNYNDYLWEDKISSTKKLNPELLPGDIILIPGGPKYFFRENITLILTGVTTLTSVAVLLVTIFK